MTTDDDLLEPSDVARLLGLSADRVRGLALEGRLPVAVRTRRGLRLFRLTDVETYIADVQHRREQGAVARHGATVPRGPSRRPGA